MEAEMMVSPLGVDHDRRAQLPTFPHTAFSGNHRSQKEMCG